MNYELNYYEKDQVLHLVNTENNHLLHLKKLESIVTELESGEVPLDDAINKYGTGSIHTYMNTNGEIVHKVSRPNITSQKELKYFLEKLNIIDGIIALKYIRLLFIFSNISQIGYIVQYIAALCFIKYKKKIYCYQ